MAWRASAETNAQLVSKLKEFGMINCDSVEKAFRSIDRGHFSPIQSPVISYADTPLRYEDIHMSAPHMYAVVAEALELKSDLTFLNIGSGSGYFSAIVAAILGAGGVSHGLDINLRAVKHARKCIRELVQKSGQRMDSTSLISNEDCLKIDEQNSGDLDADKSEEDEERVIATDSEEFGELGHLILPLFPPIRLAAALDESENDMDENAEVPVVIQFHIRETPTASVTNTPSGNSRSHSPRFSSFASFTLDASTPPSISRRQSSAIAANDESESAIPSLAPTQFICGDAYTLDVEQMHSTYDRIYVGAGAQSSDVKFFQQLLAPGGILIGPFGHSLLKIKRSLEEGIFHTESLTDVGYAPLVQSHSSSTSRFSPNFFWPLWTPERDIAFPRSFRQAARAILYLQRRDIGLPSTLPLHIWYEILEFCPRSWFLPRP